MKIERRAAICADLKLTPNQLEFVENLYVSFQLTPNEAVEKFAIACYESFLLPEQVLAAITNEYPVLDK